MNWGKFAVEVWRELKPFSAEKRAARKAKRAARRSKSEQPADEVAEDFNVLPEGKPMAIDTGLRTSTNTVVGTSLLGSVAVQLLQLLPYPDLVAALTTPEAVILWGAAIAWVVARFSKTPAEPGKL